MTKESDDTGFYAIWSPHSVEGRIDPFLDSMFHGVAYREGIMAPLSPHYVLDAPEGATLRLMRWEFTQGEVRRSAVHYHRPLQVVRNGWAVPHIFRPASNLVVSARARKVLEQFPAKEFVRVEFLKLFHYEYEVGDFRHMDDPGYLDIPDLSPEDYFDLLPDVLKYHASVGPYYEVILPAYPYLKRRFPDVNERPFGEVKGVVSRELLREFPVAQGLGGYFLSERAFEALAPFFDTSFFRCERMSFD